MSTSDQIRPFPTRPVLALVAVAVAAVIAFSFFAEQLDDGANARPAVRSEILVPHRRNTTLANESLCPSTQEQAEASPAVCECPLTPQQRVRLNHFKNAIDPTLPNVSAIVRTYEGDGPKIVPLLFSLLAAAEATST